MGKSCRLPFLERENKIYETFGKVHFNIWRLAPISSHMGYRFYVIFVDEWTRFSWIYPLRDKPMFYERFQHFHKYVKTQFHMRIKIFQSDGGGE